MTVASPAIVTEPLSLKVAPDAPGASGWRCLKSLIMARTVEHLAVMVVVEPGRWETVDWSLREF